MKINHSSAEAVAERQSGDDDVDEDAVVDEVDSSNGPDDGPTMTTGGAMPSGSEMAHWDTAMARPDATKPGSMPGTKSTPMPGEKNHDSRNAV